MSRRTKVWIVFALCLGMVVAAMGWASHTILRLDRAQREYARQAQRDERIRLALWRMDAALMAVVAPESARPVFQYQSFFSMSDPYAPELRQVASSGARIASPLLGSANPMVRLHFRIGPNGRIASPQAPTGQFLAAAVPTYVSREETNSADGRLQALKAFLQPARLPSRLPSPPRVGPGDVALQEITNSIVLDRNQRQRNANEGNARRLVSQNVMVGLQGQYVNDRAVRLLAGRRDVRDGEARCLWVGKELLLARRVAVGDRSHVVGCWLDWPKVRTWLLDSARDLLPDARLEAVGADPPLEGSHQLAVLPARLLPGEVPAEADAEPNTTMLSLAAAWGGLVLAAVAVSMLLHGTLSLSERRGAFVSSVTHELRTPLTTLRMYTEMLTGPAGEEPEKRRRYLDTVRQETERLCRLVENVLAYARLEGGRPAAGGQRVALAGFLAELSPRLQDRCERAGMELVVSPAAATVAADPGVLEQVLGNLVDNACKYAAGAADKRVHVEVETGLRTTILRVRDHGPGIPPEDEARVFRPFFRARRDEAGSLGGAGLGLAISRSLVRALGGDLTIDDGPEPGAGLSVRLPGV